MGDESRELVQGTLEMLVLKTLALEPMHGYGIALRIEQISDGRFQGESGFAIASAESHGAGGACEIGVARVGNESAREVLRIDKARMEGP